MMHADVIGDRNCRERARLTTCHGDTCLCVYRLFAGCLALRRRRVGTKYFFRAATPDSTTGKRQQAKRLGAARRDDPLVPVINGRILARLIPNAQLEIIDDGHLFMVTRPQETAKRIEKFLSGAQ
jgi:pimeloyl-ACP methyl ester carboxylesterase